MAAGCCLEIAKEQKNMEDKVRSYYEKLNDRQETVI